MTIEFIQGNPYDRINPYEEHCEHLEGDDYSSELWADERRSMEQDGIITMQEGIEPVDLTGFGEAPQEDFPQILDFN